MSHQKKIILAPSGSDGDVFPMLAFAKKLREHGHRVLICSAPYCRDLFEKNHFEFHVGGQDVKTWVANKNLMQKNMHSYQEEIEFLKDDLHLQFESLKKISSDADYIFDGGYNYAAASIAEYYKIKRFHIFHVPNVYPVGDYPCMMVHWQNMPGFMNKVTWKANSFFQNHHFKKLINQEREKLNQPPIQDVWTYYITNSILAVDKVLHQLPPSYEGMAAQTNYWDVTINDELPSSLVDFIQSGEKPFYFGLGSMPCKNKNEIIEMLVEICRQFKTRVILSKGWAGFDEKQSYDEKLIYLVDKVSHAKLFSKLDLVVHHGGPGTVHTAAKAGNVQILIPHILDQFYWGNRLYQLGVSPRPIERKNLTYDSFAMSFAMAYKNLQMKSEAESLARKVINNNGINDFFDRNFQEKLGIDIL